MLHFSILKLEKKVVIPTFLDYFKNQFNNERERELLLNLLKDCNNKKNTIYVLEIDKIKVGLIGITFERVMDSPVLSIDYLFIAKDYRKKFFEELGNMMASEFLLNFVVEEIVPKIQEYVMIRYLALYPDMQNEKLANYYLDLIPQSFKIKENKDIWILFKL
jgi:hypothetical protein